MAVREIAVMEVARPIGVARLRADSPLAQRPSDAPIEDDRA